MEKPICPNIECPCHGNGESEIIVPHGFYNTKAGQRRRFGCLVCRKTFCSTKGTAYYRLQHLRSTFDEVAALSVEGVNKSEISRVKSIAWNTVHWLERAATSCQIFTSSNTGVIDLRELQADEIRTFTKAARNSFAKCLYAQVIKTRWKDRIVKVERRMVIGSEFQFEHFWNLRIQKH